MLKTMRRSPAHSKTNPKSQATATGELWLVATPIGNLGDISARALEVLKAADLIACEDTRTSGVLLHHFGITSERIAYHSHNEAEASTKLMERLHNGARIALISDAGTPLISDPGMRLVKLAIEHGITVTPVPGASAVLAALSISGLPMDQFYFGGFLPSKRRERSTRLSMLRALPVTIVLYEAPHRLVTTLAELTETFGDRPAAVARELTKLHEECVRGTLTEIAAHYTAKPPKGECVIVLHGATPIATSDTEVDEALRARLVSLSLRAAVDEVTALTQRPRSEVYARALALKNDPL